MHSFREYVNPYLGELLNKINMDKEYIKGKGCYLYDSENNKYLDCIANYGAVPFGHNPPAIWKYIEDFRESNYPSLIKPSALNKAGKLAEMINNLTVDNLKYTTFTNSGAEAVEAAIKLCRSATGRQKILSTINSFHGKTLGALSATGNENYQKPFGVPNNNFHYIEYGNLKTLENKLNNHPDKFAAFILEPIQGEGGIITPPDNYLKKAKTICEKYDVLFVLDEIQTGLGRTGNLFAYQKENVEPDVLLLAKALGGGITPIGACISSEKAYNQEFANKHSSTFAGNSFGCHVAKKVLDLLTADNNKIIKEVKEKGKYLKNQLNDLKSKFPEIVQAVRGRGFMLGIEFPADRKTFADSLLGIMTDQKLLTPVISSFLLNKENIRVAPTLNGKNTIRIEPPLIMNKEQCEKIITGLNNMLEILHKKNTALFVSYLINTELDVSDISTNISSPATSSQSSDDKTTKKDINLSGISKKKNNTGRFAFLIHPLDLKNYREFDESLKAFSQKELAELTQRWNNMVEPFSLAETKIKSITENKAVGEFIVIPRTSRKLLEMPTKKSLNLVKQGLNLAKNNGAQIVGLGAYTAVVTRGGLYVRNEDVPVTTGNSYTVVSAVEAVKKALNKLQIKPEKSKAAVVGATGSIGKGTATLLSRSISRLFLIGNPEHKKSSRKRLYRIAGKIYKYIAKLKADNYTFKPDTIGYKLKNKDLPDTGSPLNKFVKFAKNQDDNLIIITTSIENTIPLADVTIVATNSIDTLIKPIHLKPGAVVCDMSRPKNVSKEIDKKRPDVLVIDGGIIEVPGKPSMGWNFGFERGLVYACMAETMMLALEHKYENTSLGSSGVNLESILYTKKLAQKHGFKLADLRSYDRPLSKNKWDKIKSALQNKEISV